MESQFVFRDSINLWHLLVVQRLDLCHGSISGLENSLEKETTGEKESAVACHLIE